METTLYLVQTIWGTYEDTSYINLGLFDSEDFANAVKAAYEAKIAILKCYEPNMQGPIEGIYEPDLTLELDKLKDSKLNIEMSICDFQEVIITPLVLNKVINLQVNSKEKEILNEWKF